MISAMPPWSARDGNSAEHPAPPRRSVIVLGAAARQPPAWWLDPIRAILFIVLPIFCFAAYLNQYNYWAFGSSENFVTASTFALGLYSAGLLIVGIMFGRLTMRRGDVVTIIDEGRCVRVLRWLGWITILAYVLLLGTLVGHIGLVLALLHGDASAGTALRDALGRVPGVTSFVQLDVVFLGLTSSIVTMAGYRLTPRLRAMALTIVVLTFLRAFLASERLALLEAAAAMFVTPLAFRWRPSAWRGFAPFLGILLVFLAFAAGEFFRSWQFYKNLYDSYFDFITQRFAGYFSTSINNGTGAYTLYAQYHPMPQITVGWFSKFPILGKHIFNYDIDLVNTYLVYHASVEFNNPGGFYSAFLDYPFVIASIFMLALGTVIGRVHRAFLNNDVYGLILYPVVFLGVTDLIRVVYLADTRTLPIFLGVGAATLALKPLHVPLHRYVAGRR